MLISLRKPNGYMITIEVEDNGTILDLKKAIEAQTDILVEDQRLIYKKYQLEDSTTIAYYEFHKDGHIEIIKRSPGKYVEPKKTSVLVFDVSETLQTAQNTGDGFAIEEKVDFGGNSVSNYATLIGGKRTADLFNEAKKRGLEIYIATHNGGNQDINTEDAFRKFLKLYDFDLEEGHYCSNMTPEVKAKLDGKECEKYKILDYICEKEKVSKEQILFFDDSSHNVKLARENGYECVEVRSHSDNNHKAATADLHAGIEMVLIRCSRVTKPTNTNSFFITNNNSPKENETTAADTLNRFIEKHQLDLYKTANAKHWSQQVSLGGTAISIAGTKYNVPSIVAEIRAVLDANVSAEDKMVSISALGEPDPNQSFASIINIIKDNTMRTEPLKALREEALKLKDGLDETQKNKKTF